MHSRPCRRWRQHHARLVGPGLRIGPSGISSAFTSATAIHRVRSRRARRPRAKSRCGHFANIQLGASHASVRGTSEHVCHPTVDARSALRGFPRPPTRLCRFLKRRMACRGFRFEMPAIRCRHRVPSGGAMGPPVSLPARGGGDSRPDRAALADLPFCSRSIRAVFWHCRGRFWIHCNSPFTIRSTTTPTAVLSETLMRQRPRILEF